MYCNELDLNYNYPTNNLISKFFLKSDQVLSGPHMPSMVEQSVKDQQLHLA